MTENPFESPTTDAEKVAIKRGAVPWWKGIGMGFGSWLTIFGVGTILSQLGVLGYVEPLGAILACITVPALFAISVPHYGEVGSDAPSLLEGCVYLLSGVLLHATFWTVVFTIWRRRANLTGN